LTRVTDFEDSYGSVTARFYDAAYQALDQLGPDADFYRDLARECGGPVLELGCGTGRVLLEIAAEGIACTGLDVSEAMLEVLRQKALGAAGAPPRLVRAEMQDFELPGERFPLVFSSFRAFQHLYTVEDQLRCLACVRAHLAPGGRFAFDVFNPRLDVVWVEEEPEAEDVRFRDGEDEIVRFVRATRDRPTQTLSLVMRYERRRGGKSVGSEEARFHMRWFTRYELEHLLARAGFAEVAIYGDFDRSPVGRGSPALVVVAS